MNTENKLNYTVFLEKLQEKDNQINKLEEENRLLKTQVNYFLKKYEKRIIN